MGSVKEAALRLKLIDGVSGPAKTALAAMKGVQAGVKQFNANAAAANTAFRSALADVAILGAGLVKPIRDAMKFQTALADFNKLANLDAGGLQAMGQQFTELSKRIPLTVEELLNIGSAVASTGSPLDQIVARTEMIAKAAVAWGMSTDQAGESLSKISTALGLSVGETQSLADVINYLGNSTAAEAPALADFMQRIGGMGKMAGLTAQQTTALGASIISMGVPSEVAATGLQALLRSLTKGASATKAQGEAFRALGLDARKTAKNMQMDGDGTILDVLERIRALPADKRLSVANQLFGDEGRPILALIDQLETVKKNLREAQDEAKTAGSVQDEYSQAVNTTVTRLMLLANRAKAASKSLGKSLLPVVDDLSESTGGYLDRMTAWIDANQTVAKKVVLTAVGMAGMRVAMTGLRAGFYALLRPSNLLIAGLGALAFMNFDAVSGALKDLKALATDLAGTSFVKGFLSGAGEALKTAGEGAQKLIGALRELSAEGSGLRAWLDSLEGGGWGQTLGKAAVALGGLGAAAAAVGMAVGPLRTFARVALWLSGIKPALGLLRFLRELGRSGEAVKGVGKALGSVGDQAATAGESAGTRFGTSLATAAKGAIGRAGLGAWLAGELVGSIPSDKDELQDFITKNRERSERANQWLDDNVGTPRKWLGLDQPSAPAPRAPVQGPAKVYDQGEDANRANYQRQFGGVPFEGGWHRVGRGAAPAPGKSAPAPAGDTNISAPVTAPVTINMHGVMVDEVLKVCRQAATEVVTTLTKNLDRQLNRSAQTTFGGVKPYGEQ